MHSVSLQQRSASRIPLPHIQLTTPLTHAHRWRTLRKERGDSPHSKVVRLAVAAGGRVLWSCGKGTLALWHAYSEWHARVPAQTVGLLAHITIGHTSHARPAGLSPKPGCLRHLNPNKPTPNTGGEYLGTLSEDAPEGYSGEWGMGGSGLGAGGPQGVESWRVSPSVGLGGRLDIQAFVAMPEVRGGGGACTCVWACGGVYWGVEAPARGARRGLVRKGHKPGVANFIGRGREAVHPPPLLCSSSLHSLQEQEELEEVDDDPTRAALKLAAKGVSKVGLLVRCGSVLARGAFDWGEEVGERMQRAALNSAVVSVFPWVGEV